MSAATAAAVVAPVVARLAPATLAEVDAVAALQTRIDRKYVVNPHVFAELIFALADTHLALDIDGARCMPYESVYFDTPALDSYLGAARDRRRRFKVRTRTYVSSGQCQLEVKVRGGRGETVKDRMPYLVDLRHHLTGAALAFVAERVPLPQGGRELGPTLTTAYDRVTLVDPQAATRLTVDSNLTCTRTDGARHTLDDLLIVETKSAGAPTAADRVLWRAGHRPIALSKYAVGMAALEATLPANKWNRVLRRHFDRQPAWYGLPAAVR